MIISAPVRLFNSFPKKSRLLRNQNKRLLFMVSRYLESLKLAFLNFFSQDRHKVE